MAEPAPRSSPSVAAIAFRWLDLLEKEFDKSYVDLDHHLTQVLAIREEDGDDRGVSGNTLAIDDYEMQRKFLSGMAQCFSQIVHKSQTIFQTNAKLEAELLYLRDEVAEFQLSALKSESEKRYLICTLQSALLENHKIKVRSQNSPIVSAALNATPSVYNHSIADNSEVSEDNKQNHQCEDGNGYDDSTSLPNDVEIDEEKISTAVQMRLAGEIASINRAFYGGSKATHGSNSSVIGLETKVRSLEAESARSRRIKAELESELVGARLDAKYLDKELAGRIQQIQILLATSTSQEHKQRVWSQIEAEMHLQRSKTISNMCYSKQRVKDAARHPQNSGNELSSTTSTTPNHGNCSNESTPLSSTEHDIVPPETDKVIQRDSNDKKLIIEVEKTTKVAVENETTINQDSSQKILAGHGKIKQVHLHKHDADELGMAILGGREHGLPIMISEVFPGSSVGRSQRICAGDVIIAVNGDSFLDMGHEEAVRYLSSLRGSIVFELQNTIESDIEAVCDMESRYYDMYDIEQNSLFAPKHGCSSEGGKRSPVQRLLFNGSNKNGNTYGSAKKGSKGSLPQTLEKENSSIDLPKVHSTPKKNNIVEEK